MSGAIRTTDALLRSLGGRTVLLRISAPAVAGDIGEQLGLAAPQFQDVALAPAVLRRVRATIARGASTNVAEYELLVSASAVEKAVGSLAFDSAATLFAQASGIVVDGVLLEIASLAPAEAFGVTYLYRLGLNGLAKDLV
jgi:hypothetical protein